MKTLMTCLLTLVVVVSTSLAQVPETMNYQGVLTDVAGVAVADGNYDLTFKLYVQPVGGSSIWEETVQVTTLDGVFSLLLGDVNPLSIAFDTSYWMGISIDNDGELTPRLPMSSAPYSLQTRSIPDSIVTTSKLADNAVTTQKISPGILVKSINALSDAITIAGQGAAMVTTSGDSIIISATGGNTPWQAAADDIFFNNGNVGIGTDTPQAPFEVLTNERIYFHDGSGPEGTGAKLLWYPDKDGAFRAGVTNGEWDPANIGMGSFAAGNRSTASGFASIAVGSSPTASGLNATAFGQSTTASGAFATALGRQTNATGQSSVAMGSYSIASGVGALATGFQSEASGFYAIAAGHSLTASGAESAAFGKDNVASGEYTSVFGKNAVAQSTTVLAMGRYNVGGGDPVNWVANDPLFEIGNGTAVTPANALTVLKSGAVGIGTANPASSLHVIGNTQITGSTNIGVNANIQGNASVVGTSNLGGNTNVGGDLRVSGLTYVGSSERFEDSGASTMKINFRIRPTVDNAYDFGESAWRWKTIYATNGTIQTSDAREKNDIENLSYGLDEVMQLRPVSFTWKDHPEDGTHLGLIAQELLPVIDEVVKTHEWVTGDDAEADVSTAPKTRVELDRMGVYYSQLIPVLIKAIQEQQELLGKQATRIDALESRLAQEPRSQQ